MYKYSAKNNAFYLSEHESIYRNSGTWPEDATSIETKLAEDFMKIPRGKQRIAGNDGMPAWADVPPPTIDDLIAAAEQKKSILLTEARSNIGLWQTELQLDIISDDDKASLIVWMKYIQALNAVDTSTAPDIEWPVKPD